MDPRHFSCALSLIALFKKTPITLRAIGGPIWVEIQEAIKFLPAALGKVWLSGKLLPSQHQVQEGLRGRRAQKLRQAVIERTRETG